MFRFTLSILLVTMTLSAFAASDCAAQAGLWDARLDSPGGAIRFVLKLEHDQQNDSWSAWLINGPEEIEVPRVDVTGDGEVTLAIEHYDSTLKLKTVPKTGNDEMKLVGNWKKRRKSDEWVEMNFNASPHVKADSKSTKVSSAFDGRWHVKFSSSDDPAVGIFKATSDTSTLGGTFLTTTGDYRFLSGAATDSEMELSCFDGAHAFLFKAKLESDGSLVGDFWSSNTWHETWSATKDSKAEIADAFELTKATASSINALSFPDLNGKQTRLDAEEFAASVRLVHIFGSWCPNCHDAAIYLAELKTKYGDDISIVGIAFELTGDMKRDAEQVRKYLKRHKLDHPVLIGGTSSKTEASKAVTIIDKVRSYPTTIFADSTGKIIAIHQGFSGPATGSAYEKLRLKFESTINGVLQTGQSQNSKK